MLKGGRGVVAIPSVLALITLALVLSGCSDGPQAPSYLNDLPRLQASQQAALALGSATLRGHCIIVRHGDAGPLPTPFQRCAEQLYSGPPQVEYTTNWASGILNKSGFVYRPGAVQPDEPDTCVKHVGGAWWAWMDPGNADGACASGFQSMGGG